MELIYERALKKIYRDGDHLIKVFDEKYHQSRVLSEALNQTRASDLGIRVPKVIEVCKIDNKWAIVSEFVEGDTLSKIMREHPEREEELMKKFTELQLSLFQIHSLELNDQIHQFNQALSNFDIDAITRFALHGKMSSMVHHNAVCHGDFVPSNVMLTPEGELVILDWSLVTQGDPALDIVTTMVQLEANIQNQRLAELYLKNIYELTEYTKEDLDKWVPIVSAVLSVKANKSAEISKKFLDFYLSNEL